MTIRRIGEQALEKTKGRPEDFTWKRHREILIEWAEPGVDSSTVHAGVLPHSVPPPPTG